MAKAQARSLLTQQVSAKPRETTPGSTPLNFKVPVDFRREFKTYAAQHNKKLNQLLYEAFAKIELGGSRIGGA